MLKFIRLILILFICASAASAQAVKIKDLVTIEGVRENSLVGYGLVVGLDGSGDSLRNSPFTEQILGNTLERLGVNVTGEQYRAENVAAVIVTATLPPFARTGMLLDVTVSAIGDAKSLRGGTLVMAPLKAPDGEIYVVAQGNIISAGSVEQGNATEKNPVSRQWGKFPLVGALSARLVLNWMSLAMFSWVSKTLTLAPRRKLKR